jgi:hypothetical protein
MMQIDLGGGNRREGRSEMKAFKTFKTLGLAVLAALTVMAFAGVSSAMAEPTALCSVDPGEEECSLEHLVTRVHEVSVGNSTLLSSVLNVKCNVLFFTTSMNNSGESLVIGGSFTYSECSQGCNVSEENGPAELKVLKEGHELAKVTGEGLVHLNCPGFINCRYNGVGLIGTATGPLLASQTNGEVTISEKVVNKESGTLCPTTAKLDSVTSPLSAAYITDAGLERVTVEESTALCSEDPGTGVEEVCPKGKLITHVHETTASGAKAKLLSSSLNVECDVLFLGDVGKELANPLVISGSFTYSNCNSGCTATEENSPAEIKVFKEGHELAKVTGEGLVHLNCTGFINCRYIGEGLIGHGLGPLSASQKNGEVSLQEQITNKESGSLCPSTARLDIVAIPLSATYITN